MLVMKSGTVSVAINAGGKEGGEFGKRVILTADSKPVNGGRGNFQQQRRQNSAPGDDRGFALAQSLISIAAQ